VDAGANIGLAPLYWKLHGPEFRYVGFEPDPLAAATCRANLQAWGCPGVVHEVALAAHAGKARFRRDRADAGALALAGAGTDTIEVTTVRLADFITEPVDLLKIDIEGAEAEVLADIEPQLGQVRNLFVEVHSRRGEPQNWGELITRLQRAGFRCYLRPLSAHGRPFLEVSSDSAGFDDQFNVFAVRLPEGAQS
jgi:FkbM family methyltransferase